MSTPSGRNGAGPSLTVIALEEALAGGGCALCRLVQRAGRRYLDALLYELVNDPPTRDRIRAAEGFCQRHTLDLARSGDALAIAILYEDILTSLRPTLLARDSRSRSQQWRTGRRPARPSKTVSSATCPLCEVENEAEERYLSVLVQHLSDGVLVDSWRGSAGLCRRHFVLAGRRAPDLAVLYEVEERELTRLLAELRRLIDHFDYRRAGEPLGPEADAWRRALAFLQFGDFDPDSWRTR